jgi:hypothetical protein
MPHVADEEYLRAVRRLTAVGRRADYPGLCAGLGVSRKTVVGRLTALTRAGAVRRVRDRGRHGAVHYRLPDPPGEWCEHGSHI